MKTDCKQEALALLEELAIKKEEALGCALVYAVIHLADVIEGHGNERTNDD